MLKKQILQIFLISVKLIQFHLLLHLLQARLSVLYKLFSCFWLCEQLLDKKLCFAFESKLITNRNFYSPKTQKMRFVGKYVFVYLTGNKLG